MNKINIDISENNYFYYSDPFVDFVGENKIFKESEDGGLILSGVFQELSESQKKIIDAISEFYKCLHKKYETVNQDNICFINKELFEKFKPLQNFIFRKNNQSQDNLLISSKKSINPIENKINYWIGFRKKWYYWLLLIFIFGELRLCCLKKQLPEHKDNNLDSVLNSFFSKLKPLRCFYSTMDMLAPKDFEAKNISVNELLLEHKDIFKFKIITSQKNGIIQNGTVSSVCQTQFGGKNYFYKKMDVLEKVPHISTNDEENKKNLSNKQKQNLIMGNYLGAKKDDSVIVDPIFRQLTMPIIAEHFGFDNIIPTEIAYLKEKNNLGSVCLMEEAEGKIGYQIFLYYNKDTQKMAENSIKEYEAELVDANNPNVQIEALKLGIVDAIGLILDRNAENMFFCKTKDEKFKFIGIDNDWVCSLKPNSWYNYNLENFFEVKVPFITSELKSKVLSKLTDHEIKKLLAKLEGKINRGLGGGEVMEALENRIKAFKNHISVCKVIDKLNGETAEKFMKQYYITTDNPISAMTPITQMLHSEKLLKKSKSQLPGNNKPKTTTIEEKIIGT